MTSENNRPPIDPDLRRRAEEVDQRSAAQSPEDVKSLSTEEIRQKFHELRVHQIELEMQNQQLRQAQVALAASQARYFDLYDMAPVGYCTISKQGLLQEANLKASNLLGLSRSELVGKRFSRFILAEDNDMYYLLRKQLFESSEPQECELRMVHPDGTTFWVQLSATLAQDESGAPVNWVILSDITDRKQAETVLQRQHVLMARTERIAQVGSWEWDVATDTVTWSDELFRLFQLEPAMWAPSFAEQDELYHPEDMARLRSAVEAAVNEGTPYELELRALRKDGTTRICLAHGQPEVSEGRRAARLVGSLQDITERKRAEEALRESEERFRSYFNLPLIGFAITSLEKGWIEVNERLCEIFGYPREELVTLTWTAITHPEDIERDVAQFNLILEGMSEGYSLDKRFIRKDGSVIHGSISVCCVRKPDRTINYFVALVQDITDRKQAETLLQESFELFSSVVTAAHDGIILQERSGKIVVWNEAAEKIFGVTAFEAIGQTSTGYNWKTYKEDGTLLSGAEHPSMLAFASGKPSLNTIMKVEREPGDSSWIIVNANPLFKGEDSHPYAVVITITDITEQKSSEDALQKSEDKFRTLTENAPVGIYLTDPNGYCLYTNRSWREMSGLTEDEAIGKGWEKALHPEDRESIADKWYRSVQSGGHWGYEYRFIAPTWKITWVYGNAFPLKNSTGEITEYIGTNINITKRKLTEEILEKSELKYRLLVHNLPAGLVVHNSDTTINLSNSMASTLLGLTDDQMRGKAAIDPAWCFLQGNGTTMPLDQYPVNAVLASGKPIQNQVLGICRPDLAEPVWVQCNAYPVTESSGQVIQVVVTFTDITGQKRIEEAINKRLVALTRPMDSGGVTFEELFNIDDVQRLQDEFARATGVASIITHPDGTPLTAPSNFTRLCNDIIRKTEKGCANCFKSDAALGRYNPDGPNIRPCLSGGLWDAGAGISVGGQHIANWLIGQVRDETQTEENMAVYASEIGVNEAYFLEAFREVPSMSLKQFEHVAQALFILANQLSTSAYQNIQQARFINERKQAENDLKKSEALFRMLVNTIPDLIWLKDTEGVYLSCNTMFERFFGAKEAAIIGKTDYDFVDKELADFFREHDLKAVAAGRPSSNEEQITFADNGHKAILYTTKTPMFGTDGKLIGILGIGRDISERKQSENQLLSLAQRLQLATSSARLGIWDWSVKDNSMVWDDLMFELYGLTRESFPSSIDAWMNGLHPEDKESAIAECQAALNGEKEFDTEFRVLHPDGTVKHIKGKGLVLRGADGNAERMLGINYDITEAKHAEEEKYKLEAQLQQAQKMESVGRLAGGVAHDFNNMLGAILGYAEVAQDEVDSAQPIHGYLEEIRKAAARSADLTRQLLAFARKQTVSPKAIDLNDTVTNMLKMLQRLIGEDIHLTWQPSPDQCQIKMDPSQVDQILANLCVNARDAIEDTGQITIETGTCSIDADYCAANLEATPGDYVRLVVSDNGKGMDRDTLTHVFEPFYTTKEMGKGTGLGLATVYGAVKQNNGFINLYSEPGKGTTFSLYLPYYAGDTIRKQAEGEAEAVPRGQETILLVEDDAAMLDITAIRLVKKGYIVLKADSPGQAMELAREHHGAIHLLMTDVIMPEMNGRDLARSILTIHPGMKRLFMSGYTADIIARHGVLDEGVHFIQKPFSQADIAAMVREVLDG
jgi:PAS domain S-box-containing protein